MKSQEFKAEFKDKEAISTSNTFKKVRPAPTADEMITESIKMLREIPNKIDYPMAKTTKPTIKLLLESEFEESMWPAIKDLTEETLLICSIAKQNKVYEDIPYFQHLSQISRKIAGATYIY